MVLKTARGTSALLALEDEGPSVLFEKVPGASVPLWPTVRTDFMVALQNHDFGSLSVAARPASRVRSWTRLGRSLFPSRADARNLRGRSDMLFLVSGVTTYEDDARLRNWLVGDFADLLPDRSAIAQWNGLGRLAPAFPRTRSLDPLVARASVDARLGRSSVDDDGILRLVREFAARLDERITPQQTEAIARSAAYSASVAPFLESQFARFLDRVEPRTVVMEDASYGSRAGLIALMKRRGIRLAEPQHGWIGPTHAAYNFGAAMRTPVMLATLPDELLTFGSYWGEGIRHPASISVIGKPYLERRAVQAPDWDARPHEVLFVSSVTDPDETTRFAFALASALPPGALVRFRPHPSERAAVRSTYSSMLASPRIELDEVSDLYDSLARSRAVVGVASTVLFEALAMGCRVLALESAFTDYYVGDIFGAPVRGPQDAARVADALLGRTPEGSAELLEALWRSGARDNFATWAG